MITETRQRLELAEPLPDGWRLPGNSDFDETTGIFYALATSAPVGKLPHEGERRWLPYRTITETREVTEWKEIPSE